MKVSMKAALVGLLCTSLVPLSAVAQSGDVPELTTQELNELIDASRAQGLPVDDNPDVQYMGGSDAAVDTVFCCSEVQEEYTEQTEVQETETFRDVVTEREVIQPIERTLIQPVERRIINPQKETVTEETRFEEEVLPTIVEEAEIPGVTENTVVEETVEYREETTETFYDAVTQREVIQPVERTIVVPVERRIIRLFALRQPMAADLRATIAALKIIADLERVGDLAKNIARRTHALNEHDPVAYTSQVERMGRLVLGHLSQVLSAYAAGDIAPAVGVWERDDDVDEHYNSLFRDVVTGMTEEPRLIGPGAHLLFVAKNLERIGDHATNIAEVVHYVVTGEELSADRPRGAGPEELV